MQETQETQVRSLSWEDPLEKGRATHFNILARRIPWAEEPGGLQSIGSHRVGHNRSDLAHTYAPSLYGLPWWLSGKDSFHLPMQEIQARSYSWEDVLEKEMATCSSILAWKIPWTDEPGGLQSMEPQRSWM